MLATVCSSTVIHLILVRHPEVTALNFCPYMVIQVKTRWGFHFHLNLCVCSACVYVSWLHEEPCLHEDLHEHPISSKNAVNMTCWPDLICYLRCALPECQFTTSRQLLVLLVYILLTTWRTFEFLLLHEDVSDHPSWNTMEVTSRTRSPDMNLFCHMKTRVSIQLQWSSLANPIRSLHVNTKCNKPFLLC